jgi:hypothetical protein
MIIIDFNSIFINYKYFIIFAILYFNKITNNSNNVGYLKLPENISNIKIGIFVQKLKNGGAERQTSILLNYLNKINIFELYLFTVEKPSQNEYIIDSNIKRFTVGDNLLFLLQNIKIDILIYQQYNFTEMELLIQLKHVKTIFIT